MDIGHVIAALAGLATGVLALVLTVRSTLMPALQALAKLTPTPKDDQFLDAADDVLERIAHALLDAADEDGKVNVKDALDAIGVEVEDE